MRQHIFSILLIACLAALLLSSLFHPGFMYTHDSLWHVERLQNMISLIPSQFPVRWSPTLDNGYGIPLFNFTYPLPYYAGAVFMFMGLGPVKAFYLLLYLAYFAGGVGVYFLAHKRLLGLLAGLLYLLTPYQFLDIFVRGALGEVLALGLIPWVIWSYQQISRSGKLSWYSPIPFALLLLSHNFYAYLFTGLLFAFTLVIYDHKVKILHSFLLSLALASFFIVPAFFEKSSLLSAQMSDQKIETHFVYPKQLVYSPWSYLGSLTGENPVEMSYQLGLANIMVICLAVFLALSRLLARRPLRSLLLYLTLYIFAIFMMLSPSLWFWQHLPLLASLQFPWRFLGVTTILTVLIFLELSKQISAKHYPKFITFACLLIALACFNTRNYLRPVKWLDQTEFLALHYEYVGKTTTAHRDELVPRWAPTERYLPQNDLVLTSGVELLEFNQSSLKLSFSATAGDGGVAIYHRNYYPMWHLTIDGKTAPVTPNSTGEITFPLLPGEHQYNLQIQSTFLQKLGNLISLISLFGLVIYFYINHKRQA